MYNTTDGLRKLQIWGRRNILFPGTTTEIVFVDLAFNDWSLLLGYYDLALVIWCYLLQFLFAVALRPIEGHGLLILEVFLDHTKRRTTVGRTPLDE
jgi:hypothetical protein